AEPVAHLAASGPLWRVAHRRVVGPGQPATVRGTEDEFPIVPQPVGAAAAGDAHAPVDWSLARDDAGADQLGPQEHGPSGIAVTFCLPFADAGYKAPADPKAVAE